MALPGVKTTAAQRRSEIDRLRRITASISRDLLTHRQTVGSGDAQPTLVNASRGAAIRVAEIVAEAPVVWADDGNCFARSIVAAYAVNRLLRAGTSGFGDRLAAAVAMKPFESSFHSAPAAYVEGRLIVFDPLLNGGPTLLDEWEAPFGSASVRLMSPLQHRVASGGAIPLKPETMDQYRDWLIETWES
jgi:hypothetical protein